MIDAWPVWSPVPRRPWQLMLKSGDVLRHPPEGNMHQAYSFNTAEAALKFAAKYKAPKGKE